MNTTFIILFGVFLCTGPFWGMALGYFVAVKGWRIRIPVHHVDIDEED